MLFFKNIEIEVLENVIILRTSKSFSYHNLDKNIVHIKVL